jgi:hypothetical protein
MVKKTGRGHGSKLKVAHFFGLMLPALDVFDGIREGLWFHSSRRQTGKGHKPIDDAYQLHLLN